MWAILIREWNVGGGACINGVRASGFTFLRYVAMYQSSKFTALCPEIKALTYRLYVCNFRISGMKDIMMMPTLFKG